MIGDIRYYKGFLKCKILSEVSPMKTVKVEALEWNLSIAGLLRKGTIDVVPVRLCWKNPRKKKIIPESEREYGQDPDSGSSCCYIGKEKEE